MTWWYLPLTALLGWAVAWSTNWFALRPWRQSRGAGAHWTERARLLYPARTAAANSQWLIPADLVLALLILEKDGQPHWLLLAISGWLGTIAGSRGFARAVHPELSPKAWLHETAAGTVLQFFAWLLLLAGIALMPIEPGWRMGAVAAGYIAGQALFTWRYVVLLRALGMIEPAPPALQTLVQPISARMHVPVARVWLLTSVAANAFALPGVRELIFSRRLVEILDENELAAVCAHELGHLAESKSTVALRFFSSLCYFPLLFLAPLLHAVGAPGFILAFLAVFGAGRLARALSRKLETRADIAATQVEADGPTYARALEKLHEANQIPAVFPQRQQTHPHLYDRMLAVGVEPAYPRPEPARPMALHGHLLAGLFGGLLVFYGLKLLDSGFGPRESARPPPTFDAAP